MRIIIAVVQDYCEDTLRGSLQCSQCHASYTAGAPQKASNKTAEGEALLSGRQGRSCLSPEAPGAPHVSSWQLALYSFLGYSLSASQVYSPVFLQLNCAYLTWGA